MRHWQAQATEEESKTRRHWTDGWTRHDTNLDEVIYISWMNTPGSDLNVQCDDWGNYTALHGAIYNNRPSIVAQLLGDARIDSSLKHNLEST